MRYPQGVAMPLLTAFLERSQQGPQLPRLYLVSCLEVGLSIAAQAMPLFLPAC